MSEVNKTEWIDVPAGLTFGGPSVMDLPSHLTDPPKVTSGLLVAAVDPALAAPAVVRSRPAGWVNLTPSSGQACLRVRPNPLYFSHGDPHPPWVVLDAADSFVGYAYHFEPLARVVFRSKLVTETVLMCGRHVRVTRGVHWAEVYGDVLAMTRPPSPDRADAPNGE